MNRTDCEKLINAYTALLDAPGEAAGMAANELRNVIAGMMSEQSYIPYPIYPIHPTYPSGPTITYTNTTTDGATQGIPSANIPTVFSGEGWREVPYGECSWASTGGNDE